MREQLPFRRALRISLETHNKSAPIRASGLWHSRSACRPHYVWAVGGVARPRPLAQPVVARAEHSDCDGCLVRDPSRGVGWGPPQKQMAPLL